jgi:hypothetical protein
MTITPVCPQHLDQYIDTSQGIIIDFTNLPVSVYVRINAGADILVWDNISGFQAGWSGVYITDIVGLYRLVLDAPSGYTPGDSVKVNANDSGETIAYKFRIGLERLTTETDLISPQIIEAGAYVWTGRVHNNESSWPVNFDGPGNVYLQVVDPRSSEVITVPGEDVGMVYDPTLNKVFIYFNHHGTIWYIEANPDDIPDTKNQIRSIRETVNLGLPGSGNYLSYLEEVFPPLKQAIIENMNLALPGNGNYLSFVDANFPPLKQAVIESMSMALPGSGAYLVLNPSPYDAAPTPNIADGMLSQSTIKVRVSRPSITLENSLLVGYYFVRFDNGTPSILDYKVFGSDSYIEFEDLDPTPYVRYAVMPVYYKNSYTTETVIEIWGNSIALYPNSISEYISLPTPGNGNYLNWTDSSFPPIGP